jgi:hypothetical protein
MTPTQRAEYENQLGWKLVWQSLFLAFGGDPALVERAAHWPPVAAPQGPGPSPVRPSGANP